MIKQQRTDTRKTRIGLRGGWEGASPKQEATKGSAKSEAEHCTRTLGQWRLNFQCDVPPLGSTRELGEGSVRQLITDPHHVTRTPAAVCVARAPVRPWLTLLQGNWGVSTPTFLLSSPPLFAPPPRLLSPMPEKDPPPPNHPKILLLCVPHRLLSPPASPCPLPPSKTRARPCENVPTAGGTHDPPPPRPPTPPPCASSLGASLA